MGKKSDNSGGLLALGLIGLVYFVVTKPQVFKNLIPHKHPENRLVVLMGAVKFSGNNLEFKLAIQNPNSVPMILSGVSGQVWLNYGKVNQMQLGTVHRNGKASIAPNARAIVDCVVPIKALEAVAYFANAMAGKGNQVVTFLGNINAMIGDQAAMPFQIRQSVRIA